MQGRRRSVCHRRAARGRAFARASAVALTAWAAAIGGPAPAAAGTVTVQLRDGDDRPLGQAVVAVMVRGTRATAPSGAHAEVSQRERQFVPMLRVVQTGTAVQFPNFDTVRHHVYSVAPIKRFELKLYVGTPAEPVVFDKPGVAVLGCNIHDRMRAWVVVVDTPHFGASGADGSVALELPPGEHRLRAWHPSMGETAAWVERPLTVPAGAAPAAPVVVKLAATAEVLR